MRTKLLFLSLSLSLRSVERQRPKKGARPWHYEAFTSDRLEIIRPVTSHNTKIMTVFTPTLSLPLFSPSPSHSSSSLTFFCFYCYHCQRGLRKLPEFLSSYLPPPPLLFARGNHHRVIQDDFHSRSLPKRRSFLSRCFSSVPFFSLSLLLLFFSFLFLLPQARRFSLSLLESPLARRGLEIGLRIKCLKGIADTGKGRETILLRLT